MNNSTNTKRQAANWVREDFGHVLAAAEKGKLAAQVELSKRYLTGRDVPRNSKEGYLWADVAASRGDREALHILGHCHATGTGVEPSGRAAFDCFVKAALLGHVVSVYNLAVCYQYGIGVKKDYTMAYSLYEDAANRGYAKAKDFLAAKLWNKDVEDTHSHRRDVILAWYADQAEKGDELARENLSLVRKNRRARIDGGFVLE